VSESRGRPTSSEPDNPGRRVSRPPRSAAEVATAAGESAGQALGDGQALEPFYPDNRTAAEKQLAAEQKVTEALSSIRLERFAGAIQLLEAAVKDAGDHPHVPEKDLKEAIRRLRWLEKWGVRVGIQNQRATHLRALEALDLAEKGLEE
jgi:hypothetical protein